MEDPSLLRSLTDRQLVTTLTTLAMFERAATAKLVAALAEFDRRRLCQALGFTSIFAYCTNRLGLSQDEAFHRIQAARVARRFPVVLDYLEKGEVTLTAIRVLGPHLTADNHRGLLDTASHQKQPAVALLIARLQPKPDVPSTIRRLPAVVSNVAVSVPPSSEAPKEIAATAGLPATGTGAASDHADPRGPAFKPVQIKARKPIIAPLSEASYRLQITISKASHDRLRELQALMRHVIPNGDPAAIVERSLELLLSDVLRKKTGAVTRPRGSAPRTPKGRTIPANVKRTVWKRDCGRCAFVSPDGVRCDADGFVEYHHVTPHARGGKATAENIQLRCRAHNMYEAELEFGERVRRKA